MRVRKWSPIFSWFSQRTVCNRPARFQMNVKKNAGSKLSVVGLPALSLPWIKSSASKFSDERPGMRTPKVPLPMQVTNKEIKTTEGSQKEKKTVLSGEGKRCSCSRVRTFAKERRAFQKRGRETHKGGKQKHKTTCF